MASTKTIWGDFGSYRHYLTVEILSQDRDANTSRVRYTYKARRNLAATSGAWTTINGVDFTVGLNGTDYTGSPNFDFRGSVEWQTFLTDTVTITHTDDGTKSIAMSFDSSGFDPPSSFFPAASKSSTMVLDPIVRNSIIALAQPNPAAEGSVVSMIVRSADPSYTHNLRWETEYATGTIGTGVGSFPTWTIPEDFLGAYDRLGVSLLLDTYSGATLIGTDQYDIIVRVPPELPEVGVGTPFDIRFRMTGLDGSNWVTQEIIPFIEADFTDTASATGVCNITTSNLIYETPLDERVVALEVFDGAGWVDTEMRFYMSRVEDDRASLDGVVRYTGTSYLDHILARGLALSNTVWEDATPGELIDSYFEYGFDRGWGPYMDYDFTATKTSAGTNWAYANVDLDLKQDTPFLQILEGFVTDVVAEYRAGFQDGKAVLRMYNPGTGSDWTVEGAEPVVNLATAALFKVGEDAPVRKDYGNQLTRIRVRGDEVSRTREDGTLVNPLLGHLEGSVDAADVKNPNRLNQLGDAALRNQATPTIERTFSYDLSSNQTPDLLYPYRVFRPGDWVLAPTENGPERSRVASVQIKRGPDSVKAFITVGDIIPSALAAQARKLTQQSAGAIAGGSLSSPSPLAASVPQPAQSLDSTVDNYWDASGAPRSSIELTWEEVVESLTGSFVEVDLYEVWTRPEVGQPWVTVGITDSPTYVVGPVAINGTQDFRVRARSVDGVYGQVSDIITVTTDEPDELVPAPSNPTLDSDAIGTVAVTWNGLIDGTTPPLWFAYLQAEISDAEAGSYSVAGQQLTADGTVTVPNVGAGTWWFRFTPYDVLGRAGTSSGAVSVVVTPVVADSREPKAPTGVTLDPFGEWNQSMPESGLTVEWTAVTDGVDDDPITIVLYEVWGRITGDAVPQMLTATTDTEAVIRPIGPIGSEWQISVRAMAANNVWSDLSTEEAATMVAPSLALDPPTAPSLESWQGLLLVAWDGQLLGLDEFSAEFSYVAPAYLAHVDVWVSVDDGGSYERVGFLTQGTRTQSVSGLSVGDSVRVRLVAVDRIGQSTAASVYDTITIVGINGADLLANTVGANQITAGSIEVSHVSPSFGEDLNISANGTISLIAGEVADVADQASSNEADMIAMRTRYDFTPTEAIISQPGSAFSVAISNEQLSFKEAGAVKASLTAGVFDAPKMSSGELVLQYHVIEDDPDGTAIRRL